MLPRFYWLYRYSGTYRYIVPVPVLVVLILYCIYFSTDALIVHSRYRWDIWIEFFSWNDYMTHVNSSQEHCGVAHKLYHWHLQTHWKKGSRTKNFVYTYFVTTFWAFWSPGTPPGTLASSGTGGNVTHSSHNTDTLLKKTASHMHYGCTVTVVSTMWHTWAVTRTHGCDQFVRHCSKCFLFNDIF